MTALLLDTTVLIDAEVAVVHAELLAEAQRAGRARGAHDLIIAATARATNRTVVTADPKRFEGLSGVSVSTYR
ncbi:type II toxin-antitoxin system VapC family toxin [Candidatus Poriferisodalis sp.]|uniref:type II toxin-antitoxin system VapC family toxin n=1 Tax=Candidatus Poriferisodalis sp. TaxID=3101277 RepID=UPI003AF8FFB8